MSGTATTKTQPNPIIFSLESFSSLSINPKFNEMTSQTPIEINDLLFDKEKDDYTLGLMAVLGNEYEPLNIGVYDPVGQRLYASTFCKTDKENGEVAIVFGDLYAKDLQKNIAVVTTNDDGKFIVKDSKASIELVFREEVRLDKSAGNKIFDVKVPYLAVRSVVLMDGAKYGVSYLVPFRFEKDSQPSQEALESIWINGEIDALKAVLGTPFKGGGGWCTLMAIGDSYRMCGLELPRIELQITDWESIGLNAFNKLEVELTLHSDFHIPVVVNKPSTKTGKSFVGRNISKIRIPRADYSGCFYDIVMGLKAQFEKNPELFQTYKQRGFKLVIDGYNKKNKNWTPEHHFDTGAVTNRVLTPQFDQLLGMVETPKETPLAALPQQTVDVDAKELIANLDPKDMF